MAASVSSLVLTSTAMHSNARAHPSSAVCDGYKVSELKLIGSGGTGNVYSATARLMNPRNSKSRIISTAAAFKVGKPGTDARLLNECNTLRHLDNKGYSYTLL